MYEQAIYMATTFQIARSARLSLAHQIAHEAVLAAPVRSRYHVAGERQNPHRRLQHRLTSSPRLATEEECEQDDQDSPG
jgi:hypothetical protein